MGSEGRGGVVGSEGRGRREGGWSGEERGRGMEWWGCVLVVVPSFRVVIVVSLSSRIDVVLSSRVVVACGCRVQ